MVDERYDPSPFMEWLLGPEWEKGALLQTATLAVILAVLAVGFCWLVVVLRRESVLATKITARVAAGGLVVLGFPLCTVWLVEALLGRYVLLAKIGKLLERPLGPGWYEGGLYHWLLVAACLALAMLVLGCFIAAIRHGPIAAVRATDRVLTDAVLDLAMISPRRIVALSRLAIKESIRLRVVLVCAIIVTLIWLAKDLLASHDSPQMGRVYVSRALDSTGWPVVLFGLLLSVLSLPTDIKNKTIHTVVTKPVRPSEIVLGRILGFTAMATCLLVVMGTIGFGFMLYQVQAHEHQLDPLDVKAAQAAWNGQLDNGEPLTERTIRTTRVRGHRHTVTIDAKVGAPGKNAKKLAWPKDAPVSTTAQFDHWHRLSYTLSADDPSGRLETKLTGRLSYARGMLIARVPIYGKLHFISPVGDRAETGKNVGDEWQYRSFIQGDTLEAMIWTFKNVNEANFPRAQLPDGLPLEIVLDVFRTHKGDTSDPKRIKGISGSLSVLIPESKRKELLAQRRLAPGEEHVEVRVFEAKDLKPDRQDIPFVLETIDGRRFDLFEDLISDGELQIRIKCEERQQFYGAARPDAYLRAAEASFWFNLIKGYLGIWMRLVLVIAISVMLSTFLSAGIGLFTMLGVLVAMWQHAFVARLAVSVFGPRMPTDASSLDAVKPLPGGGPFEAFYRLITQKNVTSPLEPGWKTNAIQLFDKIVEGFLQGVVNILPDFDTYGFNTYVADGYDIPEVVVLKAGGSMIAYLLPVFLAGYFFLRTREMAK